MLVVKSKGIVPGAGMPLIQPGLGSLVNCPDCRCLKKSPHFDVFLDFIRLSPNNMPFIK